MTEPSRFYRQHVALDAPEMDIGSFRPFWRLRTRLDQLLIDRAITVPQWQAAQRFKTLAEIIIAGEWRTQEFERRSQSSNLDIATAAARRIDAADRLHAIRGAMGDWAFHLLKLHVVSNASYGDLATLYRITPKTARRWVVITLQALAALERN